MNLNMTDLQAMMNGWSQQWQRERVKTQLTLSGLIDQLQALPPKQPVVGLGRARSYRGYYCDLSFEPTEATQTAGNLLATARGCMGKSFEGYKGGDYMMGETTPLWLSPWGDASGLRLVGLNTNGDIVAPILEQEE